MDDARLQPPHANPSACPGARGSVRRGRPCAGTHAVAGRGVVREEFATRLLEVHLPEHPGYYGEMVWVLMMLEQWLRSHAPDYRSE